MTESTATVEPKLEKVSLTETDSEGENEDNPLLEERNDSKRCTSSGKYASLCFLLLLPLMGVMLYLLLDTPQSRILPSAIEALDDPSNQVGGNSIEDGDESAEIIFHQGLNLQLWDDNDDPKGSGSSSPALQARNSLDNFDFGDNTFLKQNQWIEHNTRIRIKVGGTKYYFQQQADGNLVLYDEDFQVFWNSGLIQSPSDKRYSTIMQGDGNLVTVSRINNGPRHVEWASDSSSSNNQYNLALTPDRNGLMIVRRDNLRIVWSTSSVDGGASQSGGSSSGVTYTPGKLNRKENGLLLSQGLRSRIVARTGQKVVLDGKNGKKSGDRFHVEPDGAAVFADPDGGWIYVSNSEAKPEDYGRNKGGVGALYFDKHGRTTGYEMLQKGTTANCSGGKTPWNTWVTCEETDNGRAWQVDPLDRRGMQPITMDRGSFEAFAYDIRDRNHPRFFVTEDKDRGPLRRFSPSQKNWNDPWQLLHAPGTLQYLVLEPRGGGKGKFRWTTDKDHAKRNAQQYYPFSEGIDVYRNQLFFTIKERKQLFVLDLDRKTYERQSTRSGAFDGMPDQVKRIVNDGVLYFCEEGGGENGVHGRDENGWFFTILETDTFNDEATGLAFSPNAKRMYVSFQHTGRIYDIWREDGLPFDGQTLNIRYH